MAAAIPATNKWLLTKQASVALSGLCDDRHGVERRGEERRRGQRQEAGERGWTLDHCSEDWPAGAQRAETSRGGRCWTHPRGAVRIALTGGEWERKRRGWQGGGGASGMARWVQLHGVCWVQWASCPLFFHLWALCQIQSTWLSNLRNHRTALFLPLPPSSFLSPSYYPTAPPSPSLPPSLWWLQKRPPLCPLILLAKSLNSLQQALYSDSKVFVF